MDASSIILLVDLICEGVGVAAKHRELARRVRAGEKITDEEIDEARLEVDTALDRYEKAKEKKE